MHPGLLGGIIGTAVGLAGGLLGTYSSVKNTRSTAERAFVKRCAVGCWLSVFAFLAVLFLTPDAYRWLLWLPYGVAMAIGIRWMNRTQVRIRSESDPNAKVAK